MSGCHKPLSEPTCKCACHYGWQISSICCACVGDVHQRISKLEESKKYQIDENRKVSKRLDELDKKIEMSRDSLACVDQAYDKCNSDVEKRLEKIEDKIDNCQLRLGFVEKNVHKLESNQLGKQLDQQVWKFLTERIDKLEGSLFHEQMCRQELGNKIDKLEERLAHTEADMNHIPSFEYIDGLKKSLDNSFRELKFRTETERDLDDTMWEVDRIKKSSENHADRLNVIEDCLGLI